MTQKKQTLQTLFSKLFRGEATNSEKEKVNEWYNQLDVHEGPIFIDEKEEESIRNRMRNGLYAHVHQQKESKIRLLRPLYAAAAVVAFLVAGTCFYYISSRPSEVIHHIASTDDNHIKQVILPDGSKVTLNYMSEISWTNDYNNTDRKVTLSGEAFFEVETNASKPFTVNTGQLSTIVTGTSFNVEHYASETQTHVSLVSGKVKIKEETNAAQPIILQPGQMVDYTRSSHQLQVQPFAVDEPGAWTTGALVFNDLPLHAAIERLAQRHHLNVKYNPALTDNLKVTASFKAVSWQEALHSILFTHDLKYKQNDSTIYITK